MLGVWRLPESNAQLYFAQSLSSILLAFLTKKDLWYFANCYYCYCYIYYFIIIIDYNSISIREQPVEWMDYKMGQYFIEAYVVMFLFDFARDC